MMDPLGDGVALTRFRVDGIPGPKGAMSAFPIRKAGALTGKVVVTARSSGKVKEWTNRVLSVVREVAEGRDLLTGPVSVTLRFYLPRPKSAPKSRRFPDRAPDLDKLARLLLDAITGTLIEDDARVVYLQAIKQYVADGERPGAVVELWAMAT
jgi:crossover junction endodeoxyribonuclease RusA